MEVLCPNCAKPMHLHNSHRNKKRQAEIAANVRQQRQHEAQLKALQAALPKESPPATPSKPEKVLRKKASTKSPSQKVAGKAGQKNKRVAKPKTGQKLSHKELVARITEENRSYFNESNFKPTSKPIRAAQIGKKPQAESKTSELLGLEARKFVEDRLTKFLEAGFDPMQMQSCQLISEREDEYIWLFDYRNAWQHFKVEARAAFNGSNWELNLQNPNNVTDKEKFISSQLSKNYTAKCPVCQSPRLSQINPLTGALKGGITGLSKRHECLSCGHLF